MSQVAPAPRRSPVAAFFVGLWDVANFTRKLVLNLIFFGLLFLIFIFFIIAAGSGGVKPLMERTTFVLAPEGRLVEQFTADPATRALAKALGDKSAEEVQLRDLLRAIEAAQKDEKIERMLLRVDQLQPTGYASLREVAAALAKFRASGKQIVAFGENLSQTQYLLAAQANEVYMHPGGTLTVRGVSPEEARRARSYGYVFQQAGLYPWRTIAGNIKLPLEIMGMSAAEQNKRVERVLELVELSGFAKKFPWQLSGGMQQRASIARALSFDAEILLMDEPFGALDEIVRDHLNAELLRLWAATNKTIGFVTHSIPEAVYLSTKIVVMSPRPGRITDVIESTLPRERPLEIRESPEFLAIAHRVREGLRAGHAYDE